MHFVKVFIIFQETGFIFHANCLQSMHEMSNLFFYEKKKKKKHIFQICKMQSAENFAQSAKR